MHPKTFHVQLFMLVGQDFQQAQQAVILGKDDHTLQLLQAFFMALWKKILLWAVRFFARASSHDGNLP
jgi:hypothetical protein